MPFFYWTLLFAVSNMGSGAWTGGDVATTAGVAGAVPAGEAPEPGVSASSLAKRSAWRFFHSSSFAARCRSNSEFQADQ